MCKRDTATTYVYITLTYTKRILYDPLCIGDTLIQETTHESGTNERKKNNNNIQQQQQRRRQCLRHNIQLRI